VIFFTKYQNPLQTFLAVACIYFTVNFLISSLARKLEKKLAGRSY
jgi:ABC-type amino acid transport system permease subunit